MAAVTQKEVETALIKVLSLLTFSRLIFSSDYRRLEVAIVIGQKKSNFGNIYLLKIAVKLGWGCFAS